MKLDWRPMSELPKSCRVLLATPHKGKWDIRWIFHTDHIDPGLKVAGPDQILWAHLPDPPEKK